MAETIEVFVNPNFTSDQREQIGNAIVEYIQNRTKRGRGINNQPFTNKLGQTRYTKAYENHRDFKAAGKSTRPINLTLTGEMIDSIEILDISLAGKIIIGIADGNVADKARYMREKGYNFLSLSENEKTLILSKFNNQIVNISDSFATNLLRSLFGG